MGKTKAPVTTPQRTVFDEYNEGNGKRPKPKAVAVVLDHVKDENNDGAAHIEDVKLFLKRNMAVECGA